MLFNSFTFICFFIAVVLLHYILPHKWRFPLLLIASYLFYMAWRPGLIVLILFSTFLNFIISRAIADTSSLSRKKWLFVLSLIINFGLLFIFKYLVLINHSFMFLFTALQLHYPVPDFDVILPMGISFFTFQAASYTFDVYRGDMKPERNFFRLSLFITFFPQLVAGPIERADSLLPQLFTKKKLDWNNIAIGAKYLLFGYFKKAVVADRLSVMVNSVYNAPHYYDGLPLIVATAFFAFQIYCDFSGYSDIAVGSARMLGINLMQNFRQPYLSQSIREFWQRWHISLSTWFKDYLYFPLGGSRVTKLRHNINLFITFVVSGMWHGANWTFFIWGVLHGFYQIIGNTVRLPGHAILKPAKLLATFCLVTFAWIFFRANTTADAFYIAGHLWTGFRSWGDVQYIYNALSHMGVTFLELLINIALVVLLILTDFIGGKKHVVTVLEEAPGISRFIFYLLMALLILSLGVYYNAGEFIYFQF